jgi:hypothetical protein
MEVVWNGVKMGRFLFTPPTCSQQGGAHGFPPTGPKLRKIVVVAISPSLAWAIQFP